MTTKICNECNKELDLSEFNSNGYTPKGTKKIKAMCKTCETLGKKTKSKLLLSSLVKLECVVCGYNKCESAIEFHHLDPRKKDFNVGSQRIANVEKIKKELDKCVVLCSNCHRELHAGVICINETHNT